jgi:uncharacterized protein YkwD
LAINLRYLALIALLGLMLMGAAPPANAGRYYPETGRSLADQFIAFYDSSGGLPVLGLPLSDPLSADGKLVQYTERARLEWDPTTGQVTLGNLGLEFLNGRTFKAVEAPSTPDRPFFSQTGHTLANGFLAFWMMHNGPQVLGLPVSEEFTEDGLTVQYFEKGRLEYHPDLAGTGWEVQMTDLGRRVMQRTGLTGTALAPLLSPYEQKLFDMINAVRVAQGLPSLASDISLVQVARRRSSDMGTKGYFSHVAPDGATFVALLDAAGIRYSMAGETIARNNYPAADSARVAYEGFMGSPPHRQIMLSPGYSRAGIGYYRTPDGMNYFTVVYLQP